MEILHSLEVRWFLPPESQTVGTLQRWFTSTPAESARADHYLATGRHDVGFKARIVAKDPVKVETKYLVGSLGLTELAPGIVGELQRWTKLSLELDDPKLQRDGVWLTVTKERYLRKFAVDLKTAAVTEVPVKTRPDAGCGVELTRLDFAIDGAAVVAWTLGFEAFGQRMRLLDILQLVTHQISSQSPLPELRPEWTASYPAWLSKTGL